MPCFRKGEKEMIIKIIACFVLLILLILALGAISGTMLSSKISQEEERDAMKVRLIAYEGNRQQLKDFALLLEPETEFEDDLIKAILNKAEADVSIIAQDGKIGILIKRGAEV